jgi:hypothetical protein
MKSRKRSISRSSSSRLGRAADPQEFQAVAALQCFFGLLGQMLRQRRGEVVRLAFGE